MQVARREALALEKVARSTRNVKRTFTVFWEMHYGYFLVLPHAPNNLVKPDFLDDRIRAEFDRENGQDALSRHVGQRLVCECEGVAWSYHQPRFLVRAAKLKWVN